MYKIDYYKNKNDESEIEKFIQNLTKKKDKNSRINLKKISMYIELLKINGLNLGEPYLKHLERRNMGIKTNKKQNIISCNKK